MRRRLNKYLFLKIAFAVIPLLFLFNLSVNAQYNENIIKAAYIERITRFIEWPVKDKTLSADRFVLGVFGEMEFYNTLTDVFKEKLIKNHKVIVISIKGPEQLNTCNICYISEKAKPLINKFVDTANTSGVLLVSGTTDFCKEGVHINFYIEDEKLKFEINEKSITSAGFKVSYLLMQNTRIIQ
jgi:hypothetical protein